jgi:type IV secretory pathway TrbL component
MRIHEVLEITHEQYLQEFNQHLALDELSGYTYRKPTVKPQLRRAMQMTRKSTSRVKKNAGKVQRIAKKSVSAAAVRAQRQQAAQKQKQAAQVKALIRNQFPAQPNPAPQQTKPTPAPASVIAPVAGVADLKNLGAGAQTLLPKDERSSIKQWDISND